jgi:hypothetical protein
MNALDSSDLARYVIRSMIASLSNVKLIAVADVENAIALLEIYDA